MNDIVTGNFGESFLRKLNSAGEKALRSAKQEIANIDHGLYADIPIKCKGIECPYYAACSIKDEIDVTTIVEQPCPIEVTEMIELYNSYYEEFDLEFNDSFTLRGLLKELIDIEIQIRRADKYISVDADFLVDVVSYDKFGNEIVNKEISKPIEYKERLNKRKGELLRLLNVTPKDKAGMKLTISQDPSIFAADLLKRGRHLLETEEVLVIGTEDEA